MAISGIRRLTQRNKLVANEASGSRSKEEGARPNAKATSKKAPSKAAYKTPSKSAAPKTPSKSAAPKAPSKADPKAPAKTTPAKAASKATSKKAPSKAPSKSAAPKVGPKSAAPKATAKTAPPKATSQSVPPKKAIGSSVPAEVAAEGGEPPRRKRGRPRKVPLETSAASQESGAVREVPVYVEPEPEPEPEPEIIIIEFEPGFLEGQKLLLEAERDMYLAQAAHLREEADAIARELEPSDLQFDEESGEGGSVPVDREVDLMLSAQALAEVEEIDAALLKLERGIYGACEMCRRKIPEERLEVIPHARLCVQCKSGGILNRR